MTIGTVTTELSALLGCASIVLTACRPPYPGLPRVGIEVTRNDGEYWVRMYDCAAPEAPVREGISVLQVVNGSKSVVCELTCFAPVEHWSYGSEPADCKLDRPCKPLVPGGHYIVSNARGGVYFEIDDGGSVVPLQDPCDLRRPPSDW